MKKTVYAIAILSLILAGCSGSSSNETVDDSVSAEIEQIEATTSQIDSTISDIEESSKELDELLDEL